MKPSNGPNSVSTVSERVNRQALQQEGGEQEEEGQEEKTSLNKRLSMGAKVRPKHAKEDGVVERAWKVVEEKVGLGQVVLVMV